MEISSGVEKVLKEASKSMRSGYVDPQELRNLGMVMLSAALMSGESYFFTLSTALYTLADTLSSFLRVTSVPLSLEVRSRAEQLLEEVRSSVSQHLVQMAEAVVAGDRCKAMECASELLSISHRVSSVAENFKNIVALQPAEEE
ncbi:MAG: hypothetical protein QXT33_02910 [Thermofilum sp.]